MKYDKAELQRILAAQRAAFIKEGDVTAEVRKSRVSRMALAILKNIDAIAAALSEDYGHRPPGLTKAFETLGWSEELLDILKNLESWMAPEEIPGGFIQHKPKGVVGVIGAWNFPIILTFEPAMNALAAGNRVMLNFSEFHPRTGALLASIFAEVFPEEEVAFIHGDLTTAQEFSNLSFDHLFFTGSPKVGSIISQVAGKNLVPVTMELGGKNPVVVARDADMELTVARVAATRVLNGGQICLCPDYVFVPKEKLETFVENVAEAMRGFFPTYLTNPNVVSIVNDRNYERVVGLIDDAVEKGARKITIAPASEAGALPDPATRRIPPTLLLDVPETARIAHEEVFGPVLAIYSYEQVEEVIDYIAHRPSPLAAYWYGEDSEQFRRFLAGTTSGGVTRNDALVHATLLGAPFGGIGNSGSGAYHGKAGFDTFTHRRTVANTTRPEGVANALVDGSALGDQAQAQVSAAISQVISSFEKYI